MSQLRKPKFESLENRRLLAVTASVTAGGDLLVQGDADGAVEIVAVSAGAYRVTDNGVVVADSDVLTGVTDDIRIAIDKTAGADNTVTVNLGTETVDEVLASLGSGDNTFTLTGSGAVGSLTYKGGSGDDVVQIEAPVSGLAGINLGNGDNSLSLLAAMGKLSVRGGSGSDAVTIAATAPISGNADVQLSNGDNTLNVAGAIDGSLKVDAGDGDDTVTLPEGSTIEDNVSLQLGAGENSTTIGGDIGGSLKYNGRDGSDAIAIAAAASIADDFFARLGSGDNSVTLDGTVGGDLNIVSANADDKVTIADPALVSGTTTLGLGEQTEHEGHGCSGEHGGGQGESVRGAAREFGLVSSGAGGRASGFFFRSGRR